MNNKIKKLFKDYIEVDWTFDNGFHMEFGTERYWVSKKKTDKQVIEEGRAKVSNFSRWATSIDRSGKEIYNIWKQSKSNL